MQLLILKQEKFIYELEASGDFKKTISLVQRMSRAHIIFYSVK